MKYPFNCELLNGTTLQIKISTKEDPYLGPNMISSLEEQVAFINSQPDIHSVILVGEGKHFSAGASANGLLLNPLEDVPKYVAKIPKLILSIKCPTIAAMEGHAIGGGLTLGLWCDMAILAEESLYGANFMSLGFTPGMGTTTVLKQAFGDYFSREMMFTGKLMKGKELKKSSAYGNLHILPRSEVFKKACSLAEELSEISSDSLYLLKQELSKERMESFTTAFKQETEMHNTVFSKQSTLSRIKNNFAYSELKS